MQISMKSLLLLAGGCLVWCQPSRQAYCPKGQQHRHVGNRHLRFIANQNFDDPSIAGMESVRETASGSTGSVSTMTSSPTASYGTPSCPRGCSCVGSGENIQVICEGSFQGHFPVDQLPEGVTQLLIRPVKSHNSLTIGPTYRQLEKLKELEISNSEIPNIGQRTLWGLSGLRSLNLSGNAISHVVDYNFDGLHSLRSLSLDHNKIKSVTSAAFHHIPQLETLSLANNQLTNLATRIFYKLNALKHLDLSGNKLLVLDEEIFRDIRNLQTLKCRGCGLRSLHVAFSMRHLRSIDLALNYIDGLDQIEGHLLRGLRELDLSENRIEKLEVLEGPHLESLNLAKNQISRIHPNALAPTKLKHLDIGFNQIRNTSEMFTAASCNQLTRLVLAGNMMSQTELRKTLQHMANLEHLDASFSGLPSVSSEDFQGCPHLKFLNLSRNFLVSVDPDLVSGLHYLDISANFITGLSDLFFQKVQANSQLIMVYMQENPWVCDICNAIPLVRWLSSSLMYWGSCFPKANPSCLVCHSPTYLRGVPVSNFTETSLPNCTEEVDQLDYKSMTAVVTTWSQYSVVAAVCGTGLVLFIVLIAKYRHYGVYLTGEKENDSLDEILNNPVTILDRNQESYVNLKFPSPI